MNAHALDGYAPPSQPAVAPPFQLMGLKGIWLAIAQLGALGVILFVFVAVIWSMVDTAKQDRVMFQSVIQAQRAHDQAEGKELRRDIRDNTNAIKELVSEMRKRP